MLDLLNILLCCITIANSVIKSGLFGQEGVLFESLGSKIDSSLLQGGCELGKIYLVPTLGGGPFLILELRESNQFILNGLQQEFKVLEGTTCLHVKSDQVGECLRVGMVSKLK